MGHTAWRPDYMSQSFVVRRAGDATGSSSPKRGAAAGNRGRRHNEHAVRGRGRSRKLERKRKRERRAAAPDAAEVEAASTKRGTSSGSEQAVTVNGVTGTRAAAMSTQGACNGSMKVFLSLVDDVVCRGLLMPTWSDESKGSQLEFTNAFVSKHKGTPFMYWTREMVHEYLYNHAEVKRFLERNPKLWLNKASGDLLISMSLNDLKQALQNCKIEEGAPPPYAIAGAVSCLFERARNGTGAACLSLGCCGGPLVVHATQLPAF